MARPSSLSAAIDRPSLASLASSIHRTVIDDPVARIVFVSFDPDAEAVDLGFWDLPDLPIHPVDPLVGFVAPAAWDAVGLISAGTEHSPDDSEEPPQATMTVVLLGRDGSSASAIGSSLAPLRLLEEPPIGLVPDVLARVLQLPTPPPTCSPSELIHLTWLDRIATGLLPRHSNGRSWRWLADRHPLRGGGPPPSPKELAERVATYCQSCTWADIRLASTGEDLPAARWGPPGGTLAPASTWFDDGSLSRWLLRYLPPAEVLMPDLLAVLPEHVGRDLVAALDDGTGKKGDDQRSPGHRP